METCALTIAPHRQNPTLFVRTENAELMLRVLFEYRDQGCYRLHGFAIVPKRLHVLLTSSPNHMIERCAQCIKGGFSDEVRTRFPGAVWQPGFRVDWIRDEEDFRKRWADIAAIPGQQGLLDWRFVHTRFSEQLDPMPERLGQGPGL